MGEVSVAQQLLHLFDEMTLITQEEYVVYLEANILTVGQFFVVLNLQCMMYVYKQCNTARWPVRVRGVEERG